MSHNRLPERVADEARRLRAGGASVNETARRLGVSRGFVQHHTMPEERRREKGEQRKRRWRTFESGLRGVRECPGCGDEREVTQQYLRTIQLGRRSAYCARCARAVQAGRPLPTSVPAENAARLSGFTHDDAVAWAQAVWAAWSPDERRAVREALTSVLDVRR